MPQRTFGYVDPNQTTLQFHPDSLAKHFTAHKDKFFGLYTTAQQYQKGAISVINNGAFFETVHEGKPATIFYKKFKDDTYHFVAASKSAILTYHTRTIYQINGLQASKEQQSANKSFYNTQLRSKPPQQLVSFSAMKDAANDKSEKIQVSENLEQQTSQNQTENLRRPKAI